MSIVEDYLKKAYEIGAMQIKDDINNIVGLYELKTLFARYEAVPVDLINDFFDKILVLMLEERDRKALPPCGPRLGWWKVLVPECGPEQTVTRYVYKSILDEIKAGLLKDLGSIKRRSDIKEDENELKKGIDNALRRQRLKIADKKIPGFRETRADFALFQERRMHMFVGRKKAIYDFMVGYVLNEYKKTDRLRGPFSATAGSPGIGKTRFLEELAEVIVRSDIIDYLDRLCSDFRMKVSESYVDYFKTLFGWAFPVLITYITNMPTVLCENKQNVLFYTGVRMLIS